MVLVDSFCEGIYKIKAKGVEYTFEMNYVCGPNVIDRSGNIKDQQPLPFLKAASLWIRQGKKMENGLCVWFHEPELILEQVCGKQYICKGYKQPVRGS